MSIKRKKFLSVICVLVSVLVITLFVVYTSNINNSNAASNYREYRVYNAQTLSRITSYPIYASQNMQTSMTRDTFDNNTSINDYNVKKGVVKLMSSNNYMGSGFIVDDHTIATAAHCVYGDNGLVSINEILLFDNDDNIVQRITPNEIHIPTEWYNFTSGPKNFQNVLAELFHWTYDYALITVQDSLSDYMHYNLGVTLDSFYPSNSGAPANRQLKIIGYPQDSNNQFTNTTEIEYGTALYYTNNSYYNPYNALVYYSNQTVGGYSGSPVYYTENYNGKNYNTVIAIHTSGPYLAPSACSGVKITDDLLTFYLNNPYIKHPELY